jgi:flagellar basal body-associated protein FliL
MSEGTVKNNKSKKIKTILIVIVSLVIVVAIVIGIILKLNSVSNEDREAALITAGKEYYEKYMSRVTGLNEAEITVAMLQTAIEQNNDDYDLSLLDKCEPTTKVLLTLEDGEITDETIELNCN